MCKIKGFFAAFLFFILATSGSVWATELPVIRLGYIFTTNHTPSMAAMSQGPGMTVQGYSLEAIIPKEKYRFLKDGRAIAMLDVLVAKSGSETSTLFAQKHLDIALCSITAILSGIDKGALKDKNSKQSEKILVDYSFIKKEDGYGGGNRRSFA